MGNYFFKQEREMSLVVVNKERELDVYVNVYANTSDQLIGAKIYNMGAVEESFGSQAGHYSMVIDRYGESEDDQHPVGYEFHLVMKDPKNSNETDFYAAPRDSNSSKLIKTVKVGKALMIKTKDYVESDDCDKSLILIKRFHNLYYTFVNEKCDGDKFWGRKNNCHNFVRMCLEDLHLKWPESISSPSDNYQFLVDILKLQKSASIITNQSS